jgi:hypothetical protein
MHLHIHIMTHAIPNALGIAVTTMIVLSVYQPVLVMNGFLKRYLGTTMGTTDILSIFFFHWHSSVGDRREWANRICVPTQERGNEGKTRQKHGRKGNKRVRERSGSEGTGKRGEVQATVREREKKAGQGEAAVSTQDFAFS